MGLRFGGALCYGARMQFILIKELTMNVPAPVIYAILALGVVLPIAGIFLIPKLAKFLQKVGLDDETVEFLDLVDDYFDEAEEFADSTGIKGAGKLTRALTGLAEKLQRELTQHEKDVATARLTKQALRNKAIKRALSVQLEGPGIK